MLKRTVVRDLVAWLKGQAQKPVLLRGARQVGKSTAIREAARQAEVELFEINLERFPQLADVFASGSPNRIIDELEIAAGRGSINRSSPSVLLFIDEIQAIPEAIAALRYLAEDFPNLHIAAAGSLLEFALAENDISIPVGRLRYYFMQQMTFLEFLDAVEEPNLVRMLQEFHLGGNFGALAHDKLLDLQRLYLLIGGLPAVVAHFKRSGQLDDAFAELADVCETYRDDFAKYARRSEWQRLQRVFDALPREIGKKIKYSRLDQLSQSRDVRRCMELLAQAQIVTNAYYTEATHWPLAGEIDQSIFKPFLLDCGILNYMSGVRTLSPQRMYERDFFNEGKLAGQFIAQHLVTLSPHDQRPALYYWLREGKANNAELDFILPIDGQLVPIEVKSGQSGTLKSLTQYLLSHPTPIAVRFDLNPPSLRSFEHLNSSGGPALVSTQLLSLPLYMIEEMPRLVKSFLHSDLSEH